MSKAKQRIGCLAVVVVVAGGLVGLGMWLGGREVAAMTPCQRYAETVDRMLDNCHSGKERDELAVCERSVDPSPACLERVEQLSCEQIERGAALSAGEVCRKK